MPHDQILLANSFGDAMSKWAIPIALGLIVLAFVLGRIWQWVRDARKAMGKNRRHS